MKTKLDIAGIFIFRKEGGMITINNGEALAKEVIKKNGIRKPEHIDLTSIAIRENIIINERELDSIYGRILRDDKCGIITVNSKIKTQEKKDFTIGHELGHYFMDKAGNYYCNGNDIKYSSKQDKENYANCFASELLMPEEFIKKYIKWQGNGKETLELIKSVFKTSLSASAIRYALKGDKPIFAVMAKDRRVDWAYHNPRFRYKYIQVGEEIPFDSFASYFFNYGVYDFEGKPQKRDARIWFGGYRNSIGHKINEQVIPMPGNNYSILTILWED